MPEMHYLFERNSVWCIATPYEVCLAHGLHSRTIFIMYVCNDLVGKPLATTLMSMCIPLGEEINFNLCLDLGMPWPVVWYAPLRTIFPIMTVEASMEMT